MFVIGLSLDSKIWKQTNPDLMLQEILLIHPPPPLPPTSSLSEGEDGMGITFNPVHIERKWRGASIPPNHNQLFIPTPPVVEVYLTTQ